MLKKPAIVFTEADLAFINFKKNLCHGQQILITVSWKE